MLYPGWSQLLLIAVTPDEKRITACLKIHRKGRRITFNSTQHGCNCISIDKASMAPTCPGVYRTALISNILVFAQILRCNLSTELQGQDQSTMKAICSSLQEIAERHKVENHRFWTQVPQCPWPWASHFTSLCTHFFTCKVRMVTSREERRSSKFGGDIVKNIPCSFFSSVKPSMASLVTRGLPLQPSVQGGGDRNTKSNY